MKRRQWMVGAAALAAVGRAAAIRAETFPSKPIRWIIPFAAGGNYDVTSRIVGEAMGRRLDQTVVMDNRPGAGGLVGVEAAVNAPADGYTVVMASFTVLYVSPFMAGKQSLLSAVAPITLLTTVPMVVVARPNGRFADMRAVFAEARARPGTVSVGHAGNGTSNHVDILRLQVSEKVQFNIIPYKGSGPGLADLMAGNLDLYVDQLSTSLPHIRNGKLKALLAVSPERLADLPDVPALPDVGAAPFDGGTTAGLFVRAGTPQPLIGALNESVVSALKDDAVRSKLAELGATTRPLTPEAASSALAADEANILPLVKSGLLKPE